MLRAVMTDGEPREDEGTSGAPPSSEVARPRKESRGRRAKARTTDEPPKPLPGGGTPDGEKLREAFRAFEVGDFARVRARTRELEKAADPAVREAAAELAARVAVDPIAVVLMLACAAVLVSVAYVWVF